LREIDGIIPVDNYQAATLAAIKHHSKVIELVDDDDEIEWTEDPFENKLQLAKGSALNDLIQIEGPPSLRLKLRALCEESPDIFATTVRKEPANIPPLSIIVDETKLEV